MLITCAKCGHEYSSESPSCPSCGESHQIACHDCDKQYASTSPTCPYCGANNPVMEARVPLASAVAPVNVHVVGGEWNLGRMLPRHRGLLATIGATLMVISLLLPGNHVLTGSNTIFSQIRALDTFVLSILVAAILALSYTKRHSFQIIPAVASFAFIGSVMSSWHSSIVALREAAYRSADWRLLIPFIAANVRLQWGWYVLVAGGLLVLLASLLQTSNERRRWHLHFIGWKRFLDDLME